MKATLYDGSRKIPVNTKLDSCLYSAARPASHSAGIETWEKDLYMHMTRGKPSKYYFHLRSSGKDAQEKIVPVSPSMADRFLRAKGITCNLFPEKSPVDVLYQWGYGIAEEF
ncbi:MAG: hypothetical protein ABFC24_06575 [Methanoregulaceae archaeon]